jgi:hypothetical protein
MDIESNERPAGETAKETTPGQQQTKPTAGLDENAVKAMIAEAVKATEKTWQSRFDAKNTELQKLRAEKMTAEERAAFDLAEKGKALEAERAAFRAEKVKADRLTASTTAGLPAAFAPFIGGESAEEISASVKGLKTAVDALVAEKVRAAVYGSPAPQAGDSVDLGSLDDQAYMKAREKQLADRGRFN